MPRSGPNRQAKAPGQSVCKNCQVAIMRFTLKDGAVTWIHSYTTNVWCQTMFVGASAKFADPG